MQKFFALLGVCLLLMHNVVSAQSCPSNPTYKNTKGTYDLTAGTSIVIDDGKAHNVTIQNNFSSTSKICVINGSTLNLSFSALNFPAAGGSIYADGTSKLNLGGTMANFPLTITNYGTLTQSADILFADGAVINNYGTYTNTKYSFIVNAGTITVNNNGSMSLLGTSAFNSNTFTINNSINASLTLKSPTFNFVKLNNKGTINFTGATTCNSITFANSGSAYFTGSLIIDVGAITNYGLIDVTSDITINNGVTITNYCTIKGDRNFTYNTGNFNNYGSILLKADGTANTFITQGNFVNGPNGFVQGYDFNNNNSITGGGNFYFVHNTLNNGTFKGTGGNSINFYDASNTGGKFFDVQNIAPQNTTKNAISPRVTTNLVACGDPAPPVITTQPATVNLCDNSITTATFSVVAVSPYSSITYQWKKNGVNIAGATASSYTANNLILADTANVYTVAVTNNLGTTVSNGASVHYVIISQPSPASLYLATGSTATFTIKTSGATAWQWNKNGNQVAGATAPSYSIASVTPNNAGSYTTIVTYANGTCISNNAILTVENLPAITTQPQAQVLCNNTVTSATFSVVATSTSAMSYQWYKNGTAIPNATASSYTANGLNFNDTINAYQVKITNDVGTTTSNNAGLKYLIISHPANQYVAKGKPATFAVTASAIATGYQWQKNGISIAGAKSRTYTINAAASTDIGNYAVVVNYAGGNCTSNAATLTVENPPVITTQPATQVLCNNTFTSATFSVVATSTSALSYQWFKNGAAISGATASSYTVNNLTYNDTTNTYYVVLTNGVGSATSNSVGLKYLILAQPTPAVAYLATGNTITFNAKASAVATAFQWRKDGTAISGATALNYNIAVVTTAAGGKYTLDVSYSGGACTTSAATLTTSTILYSKASGDMNATTTWGVNADGSGSTPVDFTRDEHTFVVANRSSITNNSSLAIAGKLDLNNGTVFIAPGTTLSAGRIVRTGTAGVITGSATSSLTIQGITNAAYTGSSDLYFKQDENVLQYLTTAGHDVILHTPLNLTAGKNPGILKVNSGTFNTSGLLTFKSDLSGTATVGESYGLINGKAIIERYMPARRAWRLMCAPITSLDAPTINASWQEGATGNTDNPNPGYGTHITYGAVADGYDQNPQKSFSMYYYKGGLWYGIPATNKTPVTQYAAYLFFVRGNRSYDISNTTSTMAASSTILRINGYLNQGLQPDVPAKPDSFTLVANPYASSIDFEKVYNNSFNLKHTIRVWDPELAGIKGVGAYVTLDWDGNGYRPTPPSAMTSIIQPYQAFFVQSIMSAAGKVSINEKTKDVKTATTPFGRSINTRQMQDTLLEINLSVFNEDGTTGIADGVLYRFNDMYNNAIDDEDVNKLNNLYENLCIVSNNTKLAIERRRMPLLTDTLGLYLSGTKTTSYQLEFVPGAFCKDLFLYDRYSNTFSPISTTDTTRVTITVDAADALSKDPNRFSIVRKQQVALPIIFTSAKAYAKGKTAEIEWAVANELEVQYYVIEKSTDGTTFYKAGQVQATGAANYSFNDVMPYDGSSFYRIKSVDKSGKATYSAILPITIGNSSASYLTVFPNPLTNKSFQVQLSNKAAGTYILSLVSSTGQQLFKQTISYNGGTAVYKVQLENKPANGIYFIKVIAADGSTDIIKVLVQ